MLSAKLKEVVSHKYVVAGLLVGLGLSISAPNKIHATETSLSKWVEKISINGDYRLRQELFNKKTLGQSDRSRQRFRLRLNTNLDLPNNFGVKLTFASGTGEQVSTNQSFDNASSQKSFWIDKAYLTWAPKEILKFQAGRMANPFWTQYSSDVVWDGDFNPEGVSESFSQLVGPVNVFFNALQMVVDEDSSNNRSEGVNTNTTQTNGNEARDQWMFGHQIGAEFKLPLESRLKIAYANYEWKNERYGDFGQAAVNEGNRRVFTSSGALVNNFNVGEFTGVLSSWVGRIPVQVQGTFVKNRGVREIFSAKEDTGFQVGGILGKAKEKRSWEVAYFRKHVRTDATVADIADADFGDGGTNREGNIMWVAYAPQDWMLLSAKYFQTKVINVALSPGRDDINRLQVDCSVKF